jgi:hypothetical protein
MDKVNICPQSCSWCHTDELIRDSYSKNRALNKRENSREIEAGHASLGYAYIAGRFRFRLRFRGTAPVGSAGRFRFRLRFRESAPVGAKNVLCLTVQVHIVVAGSGGSVQTVGVRRFTGIISSFLFRLSESESEPESACTIRVPLHPNAECLHKAIRNSPWLPSHSR